MKKIISAITVMLIFVICAVPVVFAAEVTAVVEITNSKDGIISIRDTFKEADAGKKINILVLNPGYTFADAETNGDAVQYQDVLVVDEKGNAACVFTLKLSPSFTEGRFNIRIGGNAYEGATRDDSIYYMNFSQQKTLAADLYNKIIAFDISDETLKNAAVAALENSKESLAYSTSAFNAVDKTKLAMSLKNYWTAHPVTFGTTDNEKYAAIADIQERIKINAVIHAFNEGKSTILFDARNELTDKALISLSENLSSTTIEALFEKLNSNGKINVNNGLLNKNFVNEQDLAKCYARLVITNAIKNNQLLGSAVVSDALKNENVSYAGYSIPTYLSLFDKTSANTLIIQNKATLTVDNLPTVVEMYAKQSQNPPDDSEGSSPGFSPDSSISHASSSTTGGGNTVTPTDMTAFTDISGYKWAETAINYLAAENIINGTGNNCFEPGRNLTREQAVKIICLSLNKNIVKATECFDDEVKNAWYNDFIATARKEGFVKGKTEKIFGVGESITRQDFAVMVYRGLGSPSVISEASEFTDSSDVAEYASDAVKYFKASGIINGYTDGSFKPLNTITRAEAAQLIYSIISK